ncbi:hypothetical protein ACFLYB_05350 [Chloroflexota bacterium]
MPNLARLIHAIQQLDVEPDEIQIPSSIYNRLLAQAENIANSDEE